MPVNLTWKQVFRIWLVALPVMAGLMFATYHKNPSFFAGYRGWAPHAIQLATTRIHHVLKWPASALQHAAPKGH